jgi:hypothetical protein
MDQSPPRKPGTFLPGHDPRRKRSHRPKGALNKIPDDIRRDCVAGLAAHGYDGKGRDGLPGYVRLLAEKHPKQAARIIERILPLTVNGGGFGNRAIGQINIVSIPSGEYLSKNDAQKLREPHTINHAPQLEAPAPEPIEQIEVLSPEETSLTDEQLDAMSVEELMQRAHALVDQR